jgi:ABC-type Fe3+ transport system substrate-binding protein
MTFFRTITTTILLGWLSAGGVVAGQAAPALSNAKQQAETKGYVFFTSRDEIVAKAKQEAKVRLLINMEVATLRAAADGFMRKYPFIKVRAKEIDGTEMAQRNLLEIKSGQAKEWDVIYATRDLYSEYLPYLWRVDLFGMAEHGTLQIPPPMIDPMNRNVAAFYTRFIAAAYNKNLVSSNQVPKAWEDFLKPEFKGKKFAVDVIPRGIASLVPAWGLEKTLDYARRLAAQQPIWVRGISRTLTSMIAGEVPMMMGLMASSVKRIESKDRARVLQTAILEPIPTYFHSEQAILATAENRHAALLWLEWMASSEVQKFADDLEPFGSSRHFRGGAVEQALRGKKLSTVGWEDQANLQAWQAKVFEAYGFPKAGQ